MDLFADNIQINDLQIAKKLFEESRAGFLKLFNNSAICMSMTTTNLGKRVYMRVNKKFLEKFGFTESEVIGHTSVEVGILDPEESEKVGNILREKGRLQNDYVKCLHKNGEIVHTVSSIEKMEMNGELYFVSFFLDISRTIQQQALIEQHLKQLETLNKELEAFSYSVSHDLRAPLRAIDGYTRILEEDYKDLLDDDGKEILSVVQRNTKRMNDLIDSLLDFSRLGKKAIQKTDIDMNALVREVSEELKKAATNKAEISISQLHAIKGDLELIRQVVINLVSNALKYSSRKEKPVVEISSAKENGMIIFTVKDNGEGFDMRYASKLFGVFQRLHSAEEFEGTGVGLAIVQRIINRHGGAVSAEAVIGEGATFTFTLPIEP